MKTFFAACLIMLTLTVGVSVNGIVLNSRLSVMLDTALALPKKLTPEAALALEGESELTDAWENLKPLAQITVSAERLANVDRALAVLKSGCEAEDDSLYQQSRAELILLLQRIRAMESFSLSSII